ncbi:MAG: shikimate kinase, partial [Deltaproteobacteria bacterium]|nr:shikimate kinase [Deltaproteobacteria bacterium]
LSNMAGLLFLFLGERSAHGLMVLFLIKGREQTKLTAFFLDRNNGGMENKCNIVLIGYRCSGKTSVGKIIAKRTGMDFCDTDDLIVKNAGRSIEEIVGKDGWGRFREIEKDIIKEASGLDNTVITTGGGIVGDEDNVKNLKRNGYVVWLEGDAEVLINRMNRDADAGNVRPSLTGADSMKETKKVLEVRTPLYRKAADLVINTDRLSLEDVAERIVKAFSDQQSAVS